MTRCSSKCINSRKTLHIRSTSEHVIHNTNCFDIPIINVLFETSRISKHVYHYIYITYVPIRNIAIKIRRTIECK